MNKGTHLKNDKDFAIYLGKDRDKFIVGIKNQDGNVRSIIQSKLLKRIG